MKPIVTADNQAIDALLDPQIHDVRWRIRIPRARVDRNGPGPLISSRKPDDLPTFTAAITSTFGELSRQ